MDHTLDSNKIATRHFCDTHVISKSFDRLRSFTDYDLENVWSWESINLLNGGGGLHNLKSLPNIIIIIKSKRKKWAVHLVGTGIVRNI